MNRDISNYQGTIARPMHFTGVGLHSGRMVELEIAPALANTGIVFQRSDLSETINIRANAMNISATNLCTSIGVHPCQIATIEHLMAAFAGLGVDNAVVRVSASEIPILDGSSAPFVDKLQEVGIQLQKEKRRVLRLSEGFKVTDGDQFIIYDPNATTEDELAIECHIDFPHAKAIGAQSLKTIFSKQSFLEICEARTFCHADDVERMRKAGLAQGGSLDNAIVVTHDGILNNEGLRFPDEFVRHKLLDLIGDLALLEGRLVGKLYTHKSGHSLHAKFNQIFMQKYLAERKPQAEKSQVGAVSVRLFARSAGNR